MARSSRVDRLLGLVAAILCLLVAGTLVDTPPVAFALEPHVAPPVPDDDSLARDAELRVTVVDEAGAPIAGASLWAFALRDARAYDAGKAISDAAGRATLARIPRGEVWALAEAKGRQRASSHVVLLAEPRDVRLTLHEAQKLAVEVTDDQGAALAGAAIEARGGDPLPFGATTDPNGAASITRLGPPPWSVEVSLKGYETSRKGAVLPASSPLRVSLRRLGAIIARVVDEADSPAPGAIVWIAGSGLWPARQLTADAEGRALIEGLAEGAYELAAVRGDSVSTTQLGTPLARGETKELELRLGPGARARVRVVDGDGDAAAPVPNAKVVAAEAGLAAFPREGITSASGVVELGPLPPGDVLASARAEGFVARDAVAISRDADGHLVPLTLALLRGGTLAGEVVDARGFPVQGASIEILGVDDQGMPVDETPERTGFRDAHFAFSLAGPAPLVPAGELGVMPGALPHIPPAWSGAEGPNPRSRFVPKPREGKAPEPWVTTTAGEFRASPLPPGMLRARVRHPAYVESLSDAVHVESAGEARVRVVLHGGGSIEGRLIDEAKRPVAGARIELLATYGALARSDVTSDDGTFAFGSVPGDVTLLVGRPDAADRVALRELLHVGDGERKQVTLVMPSPRDSIAARVVDERGAPVAAAQVTVTSLSPDAPLRATRFSRDDGAVEISDAVGLPLRIEVTAPEHAPLVRELSAAPRELTLALGRGASVRGRVTSRRGRESLAGARVTVYTSAGVRRTIADSEGVYAFRDLPPGPARLAASSPGYARREADITIDESRRDRVADLPALDLEEAGSIEGVVVDARGNAVVGARVADGAVPSHAPMGAVLDGVSVTDSEGRFKLADVPAGDHVLEAYAPGRGRGREPGVRVRAARTTTRVTVRLTQTDTASEPTATGGVAITLGEPNAEGGVVIASVASGGAAERAGLRAGDILVAVGGVSVATAEDARNRLVGPLGDDAVLSIRRGAHPSAFRVARERTRP